ncbi:MAG: hypothetical protein ACP5GI_00830 [Sulfolobales archaeon]
MDQGLIDIFKGRRNIRDKLSVANIRIKQLLAKIDHQLHILEDREKILFDKLVSVMESGDKIRANIIASEIAQIRDIKKHLLAFHVVLENLSLRIENILFLGSITKDFPQIIELVRELRNISRSIAPSMEYGFISLEETLRDVVNDLRENNIASSLEYSPSASAEAKKILEEAYVVAEERLRNSFPSLDKKDSEKSIQSKT